MAEKNYIMQAVVPEAPRTIDEQQLHVYVPQGSTSNFGVFKPDGKQFVITEDGILRVDASKLIQLATPSAQVVEDGGETRAEVQFTETDQTLLRQFQFIFKNIKGDTGATGPQGPKGDDGLSYLAVRNAILVGTVPEVGTTLEIALQYFLRTPVVDDMVYIDVYTISNSEQIHFLCYCRVASVSSSAANCYIRSVTRSTGLQGPKGEQGIQGETGNDGVGITSVTQTGVQGGTQVTITLSNGQSTSFIVYNGINTNFQIVDTLPTENISTSTIYLVPSTKPEAENIYDEYIYVNNNWEHIGSTSIDLSDYVTKTYFNQNVGDETKDYIATQLSGKADASALNTKLDKVTDGSMLPQAYVKNADGTQGMADYIPGVFYFNYSGVLNLDNFDDVTITEGWNPSLVGMYYSISPCILSIGQLTGSIFGNTTIYGVNLSSVRTDDLSTVYFQGIARKATETDYEYYNVVIQVDSSGIILIAEAQKIENAGNKVTAITGTGNDTNYPTTKAVADYVTSKEPYHFTYQWGTMLTAEQKAGIQNDPDCYFYATLNGVTVRYRRVAVEGNCYYFMGMHAYESDKTIDIGQVFVEITTGDDSIVSESIYAESLKNKTEVLNAQSTNEQYPTAKAVVDYATSKEPYHVELIGTSGTLSDEQYSKLKADDNSYILFSHAAANTQKIKFYRKETDGSTLTYCSEILLDSASIIIFGDKAWRKNEAVAEDQKNKTDVLNAQSTDTQYPTAKATYDADQATLTAANNYTDTAIANAITTALNTPV